MHEHFCQERVLATFEFGASSAAERDQWVHELSEEASLVGTRFRIGKKMPSKQGGGKATASATRGAGAVARVRRIFNW